MSRSRRDKAEDISPPGDLRAVSTHWGGFRAPSIRPTHRRSYRWIVLGMGFLAVFGALGFGRFGYSAVLPAMQEDLGISSAAAGSLASWNLGGYMLTAALSGLLASRFGPRLVVGFGSVAAAAGMLLTALATGVASAAAARLLTGLGSGMVLVPSVALMASWFGTNQRGMASGIVSSGSSLALVITGPVVPLIIGGGGTDGWRLAWYFFAALTCAVGVLTLMVQRDRPHKAVDPLAAQGTIWTAEPLKPSAETGPDAAVSAALAAWGPRPPQSTRAPIDLRRVFRSRYAWHMGLVYLAFGFAYMIYFTFFQKRLTIDIGWSSASAGNAFLVLGMASIVCGFLWGSISDRVGRGRAIAVSLLLQGVAAALFAWWPTTPGLFISAVLFGLTAVAIPGVVGAGCGDQFGPLLASTSLGFVTVFLGVGQVLGPYLAGRMADAFGSLKYSYVLAAGVFFVGATLSAFLREKGWTAAMREHGRSGGRDDKGGARQ